MWNDKFGAKEQDVAERIVRFAEDEVDGARIPQPIFIVGGSGSGKSTIIKLLFSKLKEDLRIGGVEVFDGKRFFCSKDIIDAIEERKYNVSASLKEKGSRFRKIVMIDNLDYYFHRTSFEDQYTLRSYLTRDSAPLLIATISGIDDFLSDYKAPFFEGIRTLFIPKFDVSMIEVRSIPKEAIERLVVLLKLLPPVVRSFRLAAEIISLSGSKDTDIGMLLDRVEPMYRSRLESIPVNSQKILAALAASDSPVSLTEMRQLTGLTSGILSSYLRQLLKSGMIRKIEPDKHGSPYEICDKLFKLWLPSDFKLTVLFSH